MLTVAQLAPLKDRDPYLYETLVKIVASVNSTSQRAGVDPSTPAPAPTPIASISVQASNGWFDVSITDPSDSRPGLFYFAESDTTPAFAAPRVYFMGASRNQYLQLGNQTLYWRGYSQYIGSQPSAPVAAQEQRLVGFEAVGRVDMLDLRVVASTGECRRAGACKR